MKILVIGKTGQLGGALIHDAAAQGHDLFAPERAQVDITDKHSFLNAVTAFQPDAVVNTAAFHNVPLCEEEPLRAFETNVVAVKNMAEICRDYKCLFVTFSTDYVFDGTKGAPNIETDMPAPVQIYGITKLSGEHAALCYHPEKTLVIRTCGLYGLKGAASKGGNFVDGRVRDAQGGKTLEMSSEQTVSPTYTGDLSKAVLTLMTHPQKEPGTYHLVNEGFCSWHEFTKSIYRHLQCRAEVIPVDRQGRAGKMRRPLFSALKNEKARKLGIELPHWKDALHRYLKIKYPEIAQ